MYNLRVEWCRMVLMDKGSGRLLALEGLRGVAAIVVVIFHALLIFYEYMVFGPSVASTQHMGLEDNLFGSPFRIFFAGTFAVAIFFVLSGFVLSIGFLSKGKKIILQKLALKRYLRLMLPALASVMIAWLLITIGFSHNAQAQTITHSTWLAQMWNFTPNFFDALQQGTWGIFATGEDSYNPVLWTMMYEFIGSMVIFFVLSLFGGMKHRWVVYIFLIFLTYQTWYLGFIIGLILAELYVKKWFPFNKPSVKLMVFLLIIGLFLGAFPTTPFADSSIYATLRIPALAIGPMNSLYLSIGAMLVVIGVLTIPKITQLMASKRVSVLGKYTFSLYLVHKLVLFTVCTGLFVLIEPAIGYNKAAVVSILVSVPVIFLSTVLFERYIDAPSIRISGMFANWTLGLPIDSPKGSTPPLKQGGKWQVFKEKMTNIFTKSR